MKTPRLLILGSMFLTAPAALAQVAPPPPKAPEKTPEYVPPAPTEQPATRPAQRPARQPGGAGGPQFQREGSPLPDIPYEPLARLDDSGKIIQITEPSEYAATKVNPTTKGPIAQAILAHFIHDRQLQFEEIVIENLDLALEIEAGYFEQADYSDRAVMATISQRVRPLAPPTPFGKEAEAKEVMTRMQSQFNTKIAKEYDTAVMREARAKMNAGDPQGAGVVMGPVMKASVSESLYAYKRLCTDLASNLDAAVAKITLDTEGQAALAACKASLAAAADDEARIAATKTFVAALPLETAQDLLRAVREVRPPVVLPPIETKPFEGINVPTSREDAQQMRKEALQKNERIQREVAEGKRPFQAEDSKIYFKNPDGTNRLATDAEVEAFKELRKKELAEEQAAKEARRQANIEAMEARRSGQKPAAPQPAPAPEPK